MYMTTPEIRLLKFLKKIQVDLDSYIAIDQCKIPTIVIVIKAPTIPDNTLMRI